MWIYPLTHRPPPTYTFNSLVFHPRTFNPCYLVPRFPLPPFQRPFLVNYICAIICRRRLDYNCPSVIANEKAQLSLTNPRDAKSCQNCSNSTCLQRFRWQYWLSFIRLAVVESEICEIPRNSLKIHTYRVQRHPRSSILVQSKAHMQLAISDSSNFGRISYSFRDIDTFSYKIHVACFPNPTIVWRRLAEECLALTVNITYTSLKSTFSGLQFCRRHYGSIFIHLAIVAFQNREITRNSYIHCVQKKTPTHIFFHISMSDV